MIDIDSYEDEYERVGFYFGDAIERLIFGRLYNERPKGEQRASRMKDKHDSYNCGACLDGNCQLNIEDARVL